MEIKIKKLDSDAVLPAYQSQDAAGADLCALLKEPLTVNPGETCLIPTGISAAIPQGYAGFVFARSGMASKRGLAPANKVGVIDADYRGEIMVALHNHSSSPQQLLPKERIAQLVIMPVILAEFTETDTLDNTIRGAGGFGSTGTKG